MASVFVLDGQVLEIPTFFLVDSVVSVRKPERKRSLGILSSRWEDNIKMVLTEMGWVGGLDSSSLG
jgi:hypothetical protein